MRRWTFGATDLVFLPSRSIVRLITYCVTGSLLSSAKSLRMLLALLGPKRRGICLSVSPNKKTKVTEVDTILRNTFNIGFSLFDNSQIENRKIMVDDAASNGFSLSLAGAARVVAGVALFE